MHDDDNAQNMYPHPGRKPNDIDFVVFKYVSWIIDILTNNYSFNLLN